MNRKAFKYRLYPTHAQETILRDTLETCRGVYNSLLHERTHDYEVFGKSPSRLVQQAHLPVWKKTHPELSGVYSQVLQDVVRRIDLALESFFRRVALGEEPGYPRFKGKGRYKSLTYPQLGFSIGEGSVTLSKIGTIKAVLHRPVEGTVKSCTVRREGEKWYVTFSCEVQEQPPPPSDEQVGIDVGLNQFAALSNGEMIENPRFYRREEKALAKAQRKFDKVKNKHRSKARRKASKVVCRVNERIKNRRHDFVHQTARKIVNRFGLIAVEELQVDNMVRNHHLAKSISDAGWSMFRAVLASKAESADRKVIAVNPAYTSQDCSECGFRVRKTLSVRVHVCPCCGLVLDRDTNSARIILKIAIGQYSVPA